MIFLLAALSFSFFECFKTKPKSKEIECKMTTVNKDVISFFAMRSSANIPKYSRLKENEVETFSLLYNKVESILTTAMEEDIKLDQSLFIESASQLALIGSYGSLNSLLFKISTFSPRYWLTYLEGWVPFDQNPIQGTSSHCSMYSLHPITNNNTLFVKLYNLMLLQDDKIRFLKLVMTTNAPVIVDVL